MSNLCEFKPSPGKGLGVFAKKAISPGTIVIQERNIMKVPFLAKEVAKADVHNAYASLTGIEKKQFMKLMEMDIPGETKILRIYKSNQKGLATIAWINLRLSRVNHDCNPNCEITYSDSNHHETYLIALKHVAEGEEVTLSYIGVSREGSKAHRQKLLKDQ